MSEDVTQTIEEDDWAAAMAEQAVPAEQAYLIEELLNESGAVRTELPWQPYLHAPASEPMDVLVNGCLIAQGEVVVVNDKFGVRLTDIITPAERIKKLNK